jgi:predicted acetyltransferase
VTDFAIRPADPENPTDRAVLERLFLAHRHEMSAYSRELPRPDGTYRDDWLRSVLSNDPAWAAYLFHLGEHPAGFAFVRNLGGPGPLVLNTFFLVNAARRQGHGLTAALDVIRRRPGDWEIAYQDANTAASVLWPRVARAAGGDTWRHEHRPAPRPEMPPNSWVCFTVPATKV